MSVVAFIVLAIIGVGVWPASHTASLIFLALSALVLASVPPSNHEER